MGMRRDVPKGTVQKTTAPFKRRGAGRRPRHGRLPWWVLLLWILVELTGALLWSRLPPAIRRGVKENLVQQ